MEIITFFSFKGGVGRTQSLLNTACEFAQRGKNVLLVDFDLHAPGLSVMECMRPVDGETTGARPGALDFFEWLVLLDEAVRRGDSQPAPINLAACAYVPAVAVGLRDGAGFLKLVPAASLSQDCSDSTAYSERVHAIDSRLAEVIRRTHRNQEKNPVIEQIRSQFNRLPEEEQPDAIFIDSRTGITGIADLLLTRSSDRIVLVTGLNQQNLWGLESTLQDIERSVKTADWLRRITIVISPVPHDELELTEKRTRAISETLSRHVDAREREMFGDIGLLPSPVEIPYSAQLAVREDPILLRHENSGPATKYRELADRLGGKIEPLQFKQIDQSELPKPWNDGLPEEHPFTRVLPWDAGLAPDDANSILSSLRPNSEPDKPYPGWQRHALNYLANSLDFANSDERIRAVRLQNLQLAPVSQRIAMMEAFRQERQRLFTIQRSDWSDLAGALGSARAQWLHTLSQPNLKGRMNWRGLVAKEASVANWGAYWAELADSLRLMDLRDESISLLMDGNHRFFGHPDFADRAVRLLLMAGAMKEATAVADALLSFAKSHDNFGLVNACFRKAQTLQRLGSHAEAIQFLERAEAHARAGRINRGLGNTLLLLGDLLVRTDKLEEARARYDEALLIFRDLKDRIGEANTLHSLGDLLVRTDKLEEARARYDEALQIYRDIKQRIGEANTLHSLGDLLIRTDKLEAARARYDEALLIFRDLKNRIGEAYTLRSLGDLLVRTDKLEEARACYDEALLIFRDLNKRIGKAYTFRSLGDLLVRTDKLEEARACYDEALLIFRDLKDRIGEANTLRSLGDFLVCTDKLEEARARYDEALLIFRDLNKRIGEANTLRSLGDLLVRTDKLEAARTHYDEALQINREIKIRINEANTLQGLARWYLAQGDMLACQQGIDECLRRYGSLGNSEGILETLVISAKLKAATNQPAEAKSIAQRVSDEARSKGYLLLAREAQELTKEWEGPP